LSKFTSADHERLSESLSKELEIFGQIRKLTEKQSELLSKDNIESFDKSLDKRAELIEKINGLHQESAPLMQSYMSLTGSDKNAEIDNLREQIRKTVESCAELNDKNMAALKERSEENTKRIDKLSANRKGISGYAQSVPNTPEIFDKKT